MVAVLLVIRSGLPASDARWKFAAPVCSKLLDSFLHLLKKSPAGAVFNPWWEVDEQNDAARIAPAIRRNQLRAYLQKRLGKVKLTIIGEALGYRGGHFTGIPMTSERILLGKKKDDCIEPKDVFSSIKPRRTSKTASCLDGFYEPTATIVWGHTPPAWRGTKRIRSVERLPVAFIRSTSRHIEQPHT